MWPGLCCCVTGLVLGALALSLGGSARRSLRRHDLREAWMAGAERIQPSETVYVVAGAFQTAQYFIRKTGEDPKVFKIVLHWENLRGLVPGSHVIVLTNDLYGSRMNRFTEALAVLRADVRYVDLDQMMGIQR